MRDFLNPWTWSALIGAALLTGCANDPSPVVTREFGLAVRAAQAQQTINPDASKNPDPVSGIDGVSGKTSIDVYQRSFLEPPPTFTVINVGGAAGGGGAR